MKYLVNRETKEHILYGKNGGINHGEPTPWRIVEADDEGWIPWSGGECPLPNDCTVETKKHDGKFFGAGLAMNRVWCLVAMYRPILAEKEENEPNKGPFAGLVGGVAIGSQSVFDRLKSAIAVSESIPTILAEINALLPDGYCVAKREAEHPAEQPAEDMSDCRNWKEGDLVVVIREENGHGFPIGSIVRIKQTETGGHGSREFLCELDSSAWFLLENEMCFHSRPKK